MKLESVYFISSILMALFALVTMINTICSNKKQKELLDYQNKIQKKQYDLNLFEKRYNVYKELKNISIEIKNKYPRVYLNDNENNLKPVSEYYNLWIKLGNLIDNEVYFLFKDKKLNMYINDFRNAVDFYVECNGSRYDTKKMCSYLGITQDEYENNIKNIRTNKDILIKKFSNKRKDIEDKYNLSMKRYKELMEFIN